MMGTATITFSQTGVQPPVYVVTSASSPPWETLEMRVSDEQTAPANLIFTTQLKGVAEGSYQYKIRIGDGNWVLDESKETAADEHGNWNNVVHVQPADKVESLVSAPETKASKRKDSSVDPDQMSHQPIVSSTRDKTPEIPLLVVEKTDDKPAYGEDFGNEATISQKVAHDMRAADALPDQLIISTEPHPVSATNENAAPLHLDELHQTNSPASPLDAINEESAPSSTDSTSSAEVVGTLPEHNESLDDDESHHGLENGSINENGAPLLPHETHLDNEHGISTDDDDDDEFGRAPLLPHESGLSGYNGRVVVTNGDQVHGVDMASQYFDHNDEHDSEDGADLNGDYDESPLLPHERDTVGTSNTGSELSADDAHDILRGRSSFSHEIDNAKELFGGNTRPNFFRTRSNSSTLPHELPRSDAEDENLNDPLLERFPTSRDQILERVATIGLNLPEDRTIEDNLHSPGLSVRSQACSSVDLVPVKSYVSLASVPEADDSDEDDEDDRDSISSPMLIAARHSSSRHARDLHPPAVPEENEPLDLPAAKLQAPSPHRAESSEIESVSQTDGSKDNSSAIDSLRESVATPANILNGLTSEDKSTTSSEHASLETESQLRQRRSLKDESPETITDSPTVGSKDNTNQYVSPTSHQQPHAQSENFLQTLLRVLFGRIGRFLAACLGDRKRASTTAIVVGAAVMGYCLWAWLS